MLIFTASLEESGEDPLSQKQVWDAIAQLGNPEGMFALCERNDMLRETLLADEQYFKTRTRNMFSNGKPELTWTPAPVPAQAPQVAAAPGHGRRRVTFNFRPGRGGAAGAWRGPVRP